MEYLYYKSEKGNFGDDLNPWLWKQFFGENNSDNSTIFLGIGSILYNEFPLIKSLKHTQRKIVFGSGIRPAFESFKIDASWDVKFLRGPLSAASLDNNRFKYIADAAYAMRLIDGFDKFARQPKKYEIGFMPYFKSMEYFDWNKICNKLGFRFISPYSDDGVEYTISEIASSKVLITEAMHGAIVADILRVPWSRYVLTTPFTEGANVSEFKWMDWQHSIKLGNTDTTFIKFYRQSFLNNYIRKFSLNVINTEFLIKNLVETDISKSLSAVNKFYLSDDAVIAEIDKKINNEIIGLKSELSFNLKAV